MIERLQIQGAPEAKGPYSTAVRAGATLYVSGQAPIDAKTDQFALGTIQEQTRLVLENLRTILVNSGSNLAEVVKCSVFLAEAKDFAAMNEIYVEFFGNAKPARTTVVADFVVSGMIIEIDCIAWSPNKSSSHGLA